MGDGIDIDVRNVHRIGVDLTKAGVRAAAMAPRVVAKVAADITADAKALAPVDTGNLRDSIGVTISADGLHAEIGPTAAYGIYQELGTSTQPGTPFMRPAYDRNEPLFIAAMTQLGGTAFTRSNRS